MGIRTGLPGLVATDLDGTLVRSDATVSAYTHRILDRVRAAGIPVVGVTGRGPRLFDLCRQDIPSADYLVMAQGGRVIEATGPGCGRVLRACWIDGPVVAAAVRTLERVTGPLFLMVEALDGPNQPLWGDPHGCWPWPTEVVARGREHALAGRILKALIHSDEHTGDELLEIAARTLPPGTVSVTHAVPGYVEISPPTVSKATGLAVVADALGVPADRVLVFGDMPNDLSMFAWAGWGRVAVANAHPSLLGIADDVTLDNDRDGVAVWLSRMLAGRRASGRPAA